MENLAKYHVKVFSSMTFVRNETISFGHFDALRVNGIKKISLIILSTKELFIFLQLCVSSCTPQSSQPWGLQGVDHPIEQDQGPWCAPFLQETILSQGPQTNPWEQD